PHVWISAKRGEGLALLREAMGEAVGGDGLTEGVSMARERHLVALREAAAHIQAATCAIDTPEFAAEELRLARQALSRVTGEYVADDLLGEIFSRFCIGK